MNKIVVNTILILVSILISIAVIEIALRIIGFKPNHKSLHKNEPSVLMYDSIIGWSNRPGNYTFPPYDSAGSEIKVSILETGLRKAFKDQSNIRNSRPKIVFSGGSFTQGWAISDYETFAWKIQQKHPSVEVLNFGTNAYGTYQALLSLERNLPKITNVKTVVYVMITHHLNRNIAPHSWANTLSNYSKIDHVDIPFVTMEEDSLIRHPPLRYKKLRLSEQFSTVRLIERNFVNFKKSVSDKEKRKIQIDLLTQMKSFSEQRGAQFVVIGLGLTEDLIDLLKQNDISIKDCGYDAGPDMIVKGEGHPNGIMNTQWAECILNFIK